MKNLCYKVVQVRDGARRSSCCFNTAFPENWRVEYKKGEFVRPQVPGTRLYVFLDLDRAKAFAEDINCNGPVELWSATFRGKVKEIRALNPWRLAELSDSSEWLEIVTDFDRNPYIFAYYGAIFHSVASLKLLERI